MHKNNVRENVMHRIFWSFKMKGIANNWIESSSKKKKKKKKKKKN